ncbi:coxsackievirus and adenovirus receptor homolog [Pseudorasbora parva]|uniref:coxsackievirus and adenovirus receptor homolog n=1 Tax=Pseudorasbora parva TaxID=51549 RepID=UPI00351DCE73
MEMAAILGIFGICLMFTESSSALTVDIPQHVYKISRGDTVTIPCRFTPPKTRDKVEVTWEATPDVSGDPPIHIITYSGPNTMNVRSKYKDRATLIHDIPSGRADLQLQRVTSEDMRVYLCRIKVMNKDEDAVYDKARLVVLESSALTVDIPQNVYKIARGDNVRIPCRFTPPKAGDEVQLRWEAYPDVPGDPAIIILIYSSPTESKVQSKYKGSAMLVHDILSGKVYLQLQRVTRADTRVFL